MVSIRINKQYLGRLCKRIGIGSTTNGKKCATRQMVASLLKKKLPGYEELIKFAREMKRKNIIFLDPTTSVDYTPLTKHTVEKRDPVVAVENVVSLAPAGITCFCLDQFGNSTAVTNVACTFCAIWSQNKSNEIEGEPNSPCEILAAGGYARFIQKILSSWDAIEALVKVLATLLFPSVKSALSAFFHDDNGRLIKACTCFMFDLCLKQPRFMYIINCLYQCLQTYGTDMADNAELSIQLLVSDATIPMSCSLASNPKLIVHGVTHYCYKTINTLWVSLDDNETEDSLLIHYRVMSDGTKRSSVEIPLFKDNNIFVIIPAASDQERPYIASDAYISIENMMMDVILK